jgi:ketosteroid isomerase-like protein
MAASTQYSVEEAAIRGVIDAKLVATRAKDAARATACFAANALSFDVVDPLCHVGAGAIRDRAEAWFSNFRGPIGFELRDLRLVVGDGVAFAHSLNHVSGTLVDGRELDMWWRETICFEKLKGQWLITHAHDSVPFNTETGKPSLGLKP